MGDYSSMFVDEAGPRVFEVDGWNNFCRVFELPTSYPDDYCFGTGHPVTMTMVDWFYPVPDMFQAGCSKEEFESEIGPIESRLVDLNELERLLLPFMAAKRYVKDGRNYLVLYSFGGSTVFQGQPR